MQMPVKTDREYRAINLLLPATENRRIDSEFYVEGIACTFNDPYLMYDDGQRKYYEVIDPRAMDGADLSDVIMQYDHSGRVYARNKMGGGKPPTLIAEPQERGLFIAAGLHLTESAKRLYEEISAGLVTRMSIGMRVDWEKDEYDRSPQVVTRIIKVIKKVFDVSAVSIPANPGTEISARSWIDGVIETEKREAQARLELAKAKYNYFFGGKTHA
jgi:HK97 family phage prohead protease